MRRGAPMTVLEIELVPATSWGDNLRSRLRPSEWDKIRRRAYAEAGHICQLCGGVGTKHPVEAHERWHYDDPRLIQTLTGMVALCPTCHKAKHIGRTLTVGPAEEIDRVVRHIGKVNGWEERETWDAIHEAFLIWELRSTYQWELDISFIEDWL